MPQLDQIPFFLTSQLFWLAITFVAMYFIISRMAVPKIASTLQNRQERIVNDLDKAESLKEDAEKLEKEYEEALLSTRNKANAIIAEANAKVGQSSAKKHAELDVKLAKQTEKAEAKIKDAREKALDEMSDVSSDVSRELLVKIAGLKVDKKKSDKVVKSLITGAQ